MLSRPDPFLSVDTCPRRDDHAGQDGCAREFGLATRVHAVPFRRRIKASRSSRAAWPIWSA